MIERERAGKGWWLRERAVAAARNGILITDPNQPDNPVVYANPGFERITGYSAEEILGRNCRFLQGEDTDQAALEELRAALEEGRECRVVLRNYKKDGTPFWNELYLSPVHDEEGRLLNFVGVQDDVTGRKEIEGALRDGEERFRALAAAAFEGIAVHENGRIIEANEALAEMFGYGMAEVIGRSALELAAPESRELIRKNIALGHEVPYEAVGLRKDGSRFEAELRGRPFRYKGRAVRATAIRDVTERKRAEGTIRRQADLLEQAHEAVLVWELGGGIVYWNRGAESLYGWSREEALGRVTHDLLKTEHPFPLEELEQKLRRDGRWEGELVQRTRDGRPVVVDSRHVLARYGTRSGFVLETNRDVTERRRAEEEREKLLADSERRAAVLDAVIRSIPDAVYVGTEDGISACNAAALEMLGLNDLAELNQNISTLAEKIQTRFAQTGERIPPEEEPFNRALRGETVVREVTVRHLKTGRDLVVRSAAAPIRHEGKIVGAVAVNTDVTGRKRAEETSARRARQAALRADVSAALAEGGELPDLLRRCAQAMVRHLDAAFARIWTLNEEEGVLESQAGTERDSRDDDPHDRVPAGGCGIGLISQERRPRLTNDLSGDLGEDGEEWARREGVVAFAGYPLVVEDRLVGVMGMFARRPLAEDALEALASIADAVGQGLERKRAEEELRRIREAERGRIARDMHDEVLQDLVYVLQEIQRVDEDAGYDARAEKAVEALRRSIGGLRAAIFDLRLEEDREQGFVEALESVVEMNRKGSPGCEIELSIEGEGLPPSLGASTQAELLRIVREALANVRRHSGARHARVSAGTSEGKLWLEVSDNGRGIFPRTAAGTGTRGMRERSRALGGELEIQSEPGRGTKVRFEVALGRYEEEAEEETRILLVEDHASFRQATAAVLEREPGFAVVGQAGSLAEARPMLEAEPVDVAVVDLALPDGYGGDLIKELRATNPNAMALVLSASLDRAEVARAVESGAAGVLHKSVGMDEVVEAVRRLRAGETLLPLHEVVELLRFASSHREQEHEAGHAIAQLTPRETEVLRALAEGLDGPAIARRLHISVPTERNHMASILAKLGVHSRLQALLFALRHGVVGLN